MRIGRIGILGGTFDPVHNGHIYLAKKVFKLLSLDKIIFVPTYVPPHKKNIKITSPVHRYNMVKIAIKGKKKFEISDIELKRKGRSYSVETLRRLRKKYGASTEIFFITGSDSLRDIDKWKKLGEILRLCKFVVIKRPRFPIKRTSKSFIILHIDAKDISSSEIRDRIKHARPISKLIPKKVADYIKRHGLYI